MNKPESGPPPAKNEFWALESANTGCININFGLKHFKEHFEGKVPELSMQGKHPNVNVVKVRITKIE